MPVGNPTVEIFRSLSEYNIYVSRNCAIFGTCGKFPYGTSKEQPADNANSQARPTASFRMGSHKQGEEKATTTELAKEIAARDDLDEEEKQLVLGTLRGSKKKNRLERKKKSL